MMADHAEVAVLTGARDLGAKEDLQGVVVGHWNRWRNMADVWYATGRQHRLGAFYRACQAKKPQTAYLNSMFSVPGTILPLLTSPLLGSTRFVLAPRGMLKPTALATRQGRKKLWIRFLKLSGIAKRIHFHATSNEEADEIRTHFGSDAALTVIPNVPRVPAIELSPLEKHPGQLRLSFVGRVHPIKNLHIVLESLSSLQGECHLDVIGPVEDESYSVRCEELIKNLPINIQVTRHGTLAVEDSLELVKKTHAMFLPTQGENFGHAIFEAMGVGAPVLISDKTFWRDLENRRAGWDLPLEQPRRFQEVLGQLVEMDQEEHLTWRRGALERAQGFFGEQDLKEEYLRMFFPR
jgi:glycosyltransferase involved in cell wall biosynthesis